MHAPIDRGGAGVPVNMEGSDKPLIIVDESSINYVFHDVGLAAGLGAHIGDLDRLTVFALPFIGDLVSLGFPNPPGRSAANRAESRHGASAPPCQATP